jgi:serine/threonine protein kinase/Flp pilus assembly protein TadD
MTPLEHLAAPPSEEKDVSSLCDRLAAEMRQRWRQGQRVLAEDFLAEHPELREHPEAAIDLIYEELCLRQENDPATTAAEVFARFPQWRAQLEMLLRCHELLEAVPVAPTFPEVGETVAGFALLAEIGRGARGRVFLAAQPSLADRQVVVKLTPCDGGEHISLARLQHTHIVPLYTVQEDPARGLRVLCMPSFGGGTLARLLQDLAGLPPAQRSGRDLLAALDRDPGERRPAGPAPGGARRFLAGASYTKAVCWVGACLADALQYAHERGLVHLDVKPSNVLLAADGEPMLLDFHLARAPIAAGEPVADWVGGTLAYMSPEQKAALDAVRQGHKVPAAVDSRSDIYSLGLLLYEALGGPLPLPARGPRRLPRGNPQVSVGLADILHKCLRPRAADRYPDAGALAADLRRHLAHQPLRGVRNRSWRERWRKWRQRQPHALRFVGLGVAVLLTVVALGVAGAAQVLGRCDEARGGLERGRRLRQAGQPAQAVEALRGALAVAQGLPFQHDLAADIRDELRKARRQQFKEAKALLPQARRLAAARDYHEALVVLRRGLDLAQVLPGQDALEESFRDQVRVTERAKTAHELHLFVDHLRFLDGESSLPSLKAWASQDVQCRAFWGHRAVLLERGGLEWTPAVREQVRDDLLDLAVLWTDLRVRLAGDGAARLNALTVLTEAEEQIGPSRVLCQERQRHAQALGQTREAEEAARRGQELEPRSAWDYYALGRSLLRAGRFTEAAADLRQAVRLRPDGLWPNFYAGVCALRLRQYEDAVTAFTACVVKAPRSARGFANRALAYARLGRADRALADYDRALELEPGLAPAFLNRGLLHLQGRRYAEAAADLDRALAYGADPAVVYYNQALVCRARGDRPGALANARAALRHDPNHLEARQLLETLDGPR